MYPKCFYHKKLTYSNSNNDIEISDESAFSDSNDNPDYLPIRDTASSFQNDTSNSEYSDNDENNPDIVSSPDSGLRIPVWKNIQSKNGLNDQIPIWKSALPDSDGIKPPFEYFEYFFQTELFDHYILYKRTPINLLHLLNQT